MIEMRSLVPARGALHEALGVFLGTWQAKGSSYGGIDQSISSPKAKRALWTSTHTAYWHTGEFFLVQDEHARVDTDILETLSVLGVNEQTGHYIARCYENHGYYREYAVENKNWIWTFTGETERATITFSEDGTRQDIVWEWKPKLVWLPLCDRVAVRVR